MNISLICTLKFFAFMYNVLKQKQSPRDHSSVYLGHSICFGVARCQHVFHHLLINPLTVSHTHPHPPLNIKASSVMSLHSLSIFYMQETTLHTAGWYGHQPLKWKFISLIEFRIISQVE